MMSATILVPSFLLFVWVLLMLALFNPSKKAGLVSKKIALANYFGYNQVRNEAKEIGWNITTKEFFLMVAFAVFIGVTLAAVFKNALIIFAGIIAGYYLPRYSVQKMRKRQRLNLMITVPDFGRLLIARLIDHNSIVRAFEVTNSDLTGPIKTMVEEFVKDVGVGIGVQQALENLKNKVAFRKFNTFIETLLIAHQEGYSNEALRAMEKSVEAIENDLRAIEWLEITTKTKKRELLYVVVAAWSFPLMLSFLNSDNANIYLDSFFGKVLMFSYVISTLFVLIKGEDYLSLKLEEL